MTAFERLYSGQGISFRYPEGWQLAEESREDAVTISVSDGAAFWSVTVLRRRPPAEHVLSEASQAFRDEYNEIDEYPAKGRIGGEPAEARDLEFVSLELINSVFLRAVQSGGVTLFVMAQVTEHERSRYEPVFQSISDSLERTPDEEIMIP